KNNTDSAGNSYGCHENYLVDRAVPFGRLVSDITPHFVTRQVFCGAGKVGAEAHGGDVDFQLSQRADFFEEEVGLETTLKRPIVNTRDEPHCDPLKYRRLHVIVGDANMSQTATFLKLATTSIVLAMIEDDFPMGDLALAHPVPAIRQVSHDPTLRQTVLLRDGRRLTGLEVQWALLEAAQKYAIERGLECLGDDAGGALGDRALELWSQVLADLEGGRAASTVDWAAKLRLLDAYASRHGLTDGDARLKVIDLQYHDLRPGRGLAARVGLAELVDRADVERAVTDPPPSTRAFFRGTCLRRWPENVVAANWDSVVFDTGRDPLVRVPMPEPLRGTRDLVGPLFDRATSPSDLIALLAGGEPRV
ncbi:MAG: proteasome accessory factor PafA2 family protein, partial [Ilumatobacteraceae bacterium]